MKECVNCGRPATQKSGRRHLCADCAVGEKIEYWPEENTVIDRNGEVVLGNLRADGIDSEDKAAAAAKMLNDGKSKDRVCERMKGKR